MTALQTHIVIKLQTQKTLIAKKVKSKSFDEIQKHKLWQNSKKYYFDNSNSEEEFLTQSFGKNNLTPQQPMSYALLRFC